MTEKKEITEVKVVELKKILSNPNNPRIIKDDKYRKLLRSIQEFPKMLWARPIVVDDNYMVLGGNMRLKACKEAGLKEVPVQIALNWTQEEKNEFVIKDNLNYGEWNYDDLANEWDATQLSEWGMDIPSFDDNFSEDAINEDNPIEADNTVTITLTMSYHHYESAEKDLNEFMGKHPSVICKIQN